MEGIDMAEVDSFAGNWIYRGFENNPELDTPTEDLLIASFDLTLEIEDAVGLSAGLSTGGISAGLSIGRSEVSGRLSFGEDYDLSVSGTARPGEPPTIRFRATGIEGTFTAGWIYDYLGYLTPSWPTSVGQRPTIVGTVLRTVPHPGSGGEVRPAGFTLSFIAVSRDYPPDS
ncbi:MAG: hypothetical protein ACT4NY_00985 [Pseudonocardiales bacterium]